MKHWKEILGIAGACIAFYIGAGFATMQEVMQYEASYGSAFIIAVLVAATIYVYTNFSFAINGGKDKEIYKLYCGKYVGAFYDWFSAIFCYMCYIVMLGGANSTAMEQWGLPNSAGAIIMAMITLITVVFGFDGIVKALGNIGPIIIVFILVISTIVAIRDFSMFSMGVETIERHVYDIAQVGNGNPVASGASYGGFVILWFATFIAEMAHEKSKNQIKWGIIISAIAIFLVSIICCIALISNIDSLWDAGVPALVLANSINPYLAIVFAAIVFAGIYTSAVPLLWTGVRKFSFGKEKRYKLITIAGSIVGCIVACYIPYKGLINILYGLNGYLGFALIAFMLVKDTRNILKK